ncbi:sensor histidine kinase [Pseudonocardia sp. GCM10023141]|uniref:sensor histidine kinase n=1 Tax=Pseudonocardia sp. GCM10023141 TaxID=3252653 RepID=UPI003614D155
MIIAPEVMAVAVEHARRGVRLQLVLRWVLVVFVAVTIAAVQPAHHTLLCAVIAAGYAVWAASVALWVRLDRSGALQLAWLALFVDLAVLGVLTLLTGVATPQSWTSDVLTTGFLIIPVLAATQLRPRVCAAVVVPTAVVYLLAGIATQEANAEPWSSLLLRTLVVAGVAAGCIGLSRIQRSRVETIGQLVSTRTDLLAELGDIEQHERRTLSEHLHDGALQFVLAARQDLEDARDTGDAEAFDRLEEALRETTRLLRSTVAELHPAVLARAGLPAALGDVTNTAAARGGFAATVDVDRWPAGVPTSADALLFRTARELLANVVKHARATTVSVTLSRTGDRATLVVTDDGVGLPASGVGGEVGGGHIGLVSHTARVGAAGGRMAVAPGAGGGTVGTVELPCVSTDRPTSGSAGAPAIRPTVQSPSTQHS